MSKKIRRFRLLFDSSFPRKEVLLRLSKKANISHVVQDYNYPNQSEDRDIFDLATKVDRFVVTVNKKHFKKFLDKIKPGIVILPSGLSNEELEKSLIKLIANKNPDDFYGKILE